MVVQLLGIDFHWLDWGIGDGWYPGVLVRCGMRDLYFGALLNVSWFLSYDVWRPESNHVHEMTRVP